MAPERLPGLAWARLLAAATVRGGGVVRWGTASAQRGAAGARRGGLAHHDCWHGKPTTPSVLEPWSLRANRSTSTSTSTSAACPPVPRPAATRRQPTKSEARAWQVLRAHTHVQWRDARHTHPRAHTDATLLCAQRPTHLSVSNARHRQHAPYPTGAACPAGGWLRKHRGERSMRRLQARAQPQRRLPQPPTCACVVVVWNM